MSNIKVLDIINTAEQCRKELISTNKHYGIDTSNTATLPEAIGDYKQYGTRVQEEGHEVRWIDVDGRCETIYVADGQDAVAPFTPNYDPEYLEFYRWICTAQSMQNVTHEMDCGAYYQTKQLSGEDPLWTAISSTLQDPGTVTIRPTVLKIKLTDSTNLGVTLTASSSPFVDWGDGTVDQNLSHTYSSVGKYVIRVANKTSYNISDISLKGYVTHLYLGNYLSGYTNSSVNQGLYQIIRNQNKLEVLVFSDSYFNSSYVTSNYYYFFSAGINCKVNIIPYTSRTIGCVISGNSSVYNLRYSVSEYGYTDLYPIYSNGGGYLEKYVLPDSVVNINGYGGNMSFGKIIGLNEVQCSSEGSNNHAKFPFVKHFNLTLTGTIPSYLFGIGNYQQGGYLPEIINFGSGVISVSDKWVNGVTSQYSGNFNRIKFINIANDFNSPLFTLTFNRGYPSIWLSDNNIIDIAQKLKDNTGNVSNTLILHPNDEDRFNNLFVNSTGQQVPEGTAGAITLLQYIQNKNWTVSFSNS